MAENLIRLIAQAKPKAALLTSYTFGLSYFEAAILPALVRHGCGNVSVLVDDVQYQASLGESHSSFAGRSYRICAVPAPGGGIFHPKLAYFECEDSDILLVASGNLTFSGQGGNLECLDAIRSSDVPEVFEETSSFFEGLAGAISVTSSQAVKVLHLYAQRASAQGKKFRTARAPAQRSVWLLHTLATPVSEQLIALIPTVGADFKRLTVMSPYHAPDAAPIRSFARRLGVPKTELSLDPKDHTIALDAKRFGTPKDVSFVLPDLGEDSRESHAKWFEIAMSDGIFVMTGSVNATEQSFASTKNVEVSLARMLAKSHVKWKKANPREIKYTPFPYSGHIEGVGIVDATLRSDGLLVGVIQAVSFAAGPIDVELVQEGERVFDVHDVALAESGTFKCGIDTKFTEAHRSLQVRVQGSGFNALGWVSNELQLEATEADRQKMAAVNRILADSFSADDVYELFSLLIDYTNTPATKTAKRTQSPASPEEDQKPTPFSLESWVTSGESSTRSGLLGVSSGRGFDALYAWINATSKPDGAGQGGGQPGAKDHLKGTGGDDKKDRKILSDAQEQDKGASEREAKEERNRRLVQRLLEAIPQKLKENPAHPGAADLVRVMGAFSVRNAVRGGVLDARSSLAAQPCLTWLDVYSRIGLERSAIGALEPTIVAMGCLALGLAQTAGAAQQAASQVKEDYQRFGLVAHDDQRLRELCRLGIQHRAFDLLDRATRDQLENAVPSILAVETGADVVSRVFTQLESGEFSGISKQDAQLLGADFASALRAQMKSKKKRYGRVQNVDGRTVSCPCCYVGLSVDTMRRLRRTHAAVCTNIICGRALIWLPQITNV